MASRFNTLEALETRRLLAAAVAPAYADKIGLTNILNLAPTFNDDFNGNSLDPTKWQIRESKRWHTTTSPSSPLAYTSEDAIRVGNGELELIAHQDDNGVYKSAWIQTSRDAAANVATPTLKAGRSADFDQKFGYWEARLKFDSMPGMWSAFWVQSSKMTQVGNDQAKANHPEIYGTEMDIAESGAIRGGSKAIDDVSSVIHASGYGAKHKSSAVHTNVKSLSGTATSQFHTYGMLWSDKSVLFYVDGNLVQKITDRTFVSKVAQTTILSNEIGAPSGGSYFGSIPKGGFGGLDDSKAKMTADYVRVWQFKGASTTPGTPSTPPPPTTPGTPAVQTATVTGTVFNDLNANGIRNANEAVLSGKTVYIDTNNNKKLDASEVHAVTNSSGVYTLSNVKAGTVIVRQVLASGMQQSAPMTEASQTLKLAGGAKVTLVFATLTTPVVVPPVVTPPVITPPVVTPPVVVPPVVTPPVVKPPVVTPPVTNLKGTANVTGSIYIDKNLNGVRDGNEVGIANLLVYIDTNKNGKRDANEVYTRTNKGGGYIFDRLKAATYTFRIDLTGSQYAQSFPLELKARTLIVRAGHSYVYKNFRVQKFAA